MNDFKRQIRRLFCGGCSLYVEDKLSCCYVDGSGKDKYCPMVLEKTKTLFALRSSEGYRLAVVNDKDTLPIDECKDNYLLFECLKLNGVVDKIQSCHDCTNKVVVNYVKEIKND